jgi:teichuronic acid biosynthesis glycosyltransferase TuaC
MSGAAEVNSPLHVLTLTPFFPSSENEVSGCFVAEPIEQLKQFGIESRVIAVSPIHHPRKKPSSSAAAEWVRYLQVPGNLGLSSAGKLLYARVLPNVLRRVKPIDVIHAHAALPCGHAAALLSRRLRIPFVVTVHGLDVFNTCFLGGIPAVWRRKVSVDVYRAAQTVVCISGKVQEILKTGMPSETRSAIVYNGVNPILFSPDSHAAELLDTEILVVGNLLRSKGHEIVLRALANLRASFPKLRCRIIGEGPEHARFEALVRDLGIGIERHVQFVGRQSRSEVAEAMRRCSVFVLPSRNEGLGCVYLEAMSCGKPVIGCRGQGIEEVIEHGKNGWLIPPDGLEELVQGLAALLGSPETCARIGTAARQTILENFTLSHQAEHLATIYRQAIT